MMIFKNNEHEKNYYATLELMKNSDCYHKAVAYLFTLDTVCFEHIHDVFNFADNGIIPEGLDKAWQTGTSKKTTRLAFNLYNDRCTDGETYIGSDGYEEDMLRTIGRQSKFAFPNIADNIPSVIDMMDDEEE